MTDTTEAEARLDQSRRWLVFAIDSGPFTNGAAALAGHEEMVRATEREKVRALVERLVGGPADEPLHEDDDDMRMWCWFCFGNTHNTNSEEQYTDHAEDCPWVEARLWLDGGAE